MFIFCLNPAFAGVELEECSLIAGQTGRLEVFYTISTCHPPEIIFLYAVVLFHIS